VFKYFKLRWYCFSKRFFCSPERPGMLWGPSSFLFSGYGVLSPGVKQPGRDVYHSPPSIAYVKITCPHGIDRKTFTFVFFTYTVRSKSFRADFF
jgi:hypothetical protein